MDEKSCGVVVFSQKKFLLLNYTQGHWGFPKGNVESGESDEETALRELKEETNLSALLIPGFKQKINYNLIRDDKKLSKEVTFFLGNVSSTQVLLSHEHSGFLWLPFKAALDKLTFEQTKEVLVKANAWLKVNEKSKTS